MPRIILFFLTSISVIFSAFSALARETAADDDNASQVHDHGHEKNNEMEEIFVTGAPHIRARMDVLQGSSLIGLDELEQRMEATIGETLSGIPGISSSFFGPGASRPIIRGLGGDRIKVMTNGIGSIDASSTSPDHAVAIDPLTAERIEILRGASTLLYGSNAVGGVVNIIDSRIPSVIPGGDISGRTRFAYSTVADDYSGGASLNVKLSETGDSAVVLHLDGFFRNSSDYDIPGEAISEILEATAAEEDEDHEDLEIGKVENSDVDNKGGAVGLSWIGETAMLGVSFSINDSNYGVPGGHLHEEEEDHEDEDHEEEEEELVRIDLDQKRFDLKGNLSRDFLIFEEARLRFGYADYEHVELEGDEIGTIFNNTGWEGRLEFIQKEMGIVHGSMGLQVRKRDFEAIGAEAFVPPTKTLQWGVFAVEEISLDPVTLEFGARFDHQSTENKTLGIKRNFNNISLSAGAAIHPTANSLVGLSLSRTERAPTAEELFSNGPHLATSAFEIGDVDLKKERATSLELTLKQESEAFSASLNLYHTWFDNFIAEEFTGLQQDGLNVLRFHQRDARFYGAELEGSYLVYAQEGHELRLNISGDIVRANFTNNGGDLPRIPAKSAIFGFKYENIYFDVAGNVRLLDDQSRLAENELMTKGYTEFNLDLSWRPYGKDRNLTIRLQGKNLGNAERRQHTSFLKDLLPLPGRTVKLSARFDF